MQRAVEKTHKNGAAERGREQGVFRRLPQADEGAVCDISRLRVSAEKDPRL